MTNPFQQGESGFPGSNSPTGTPGVYRRFSSNASVTSPGASASGSAQTFSQLTRTPSAFSRLLNPANDFQSDSAAAGTANSMDRDSNGVGSGGPGSNGSSWMPPRTQPLPSFSRAFDLFVAASGSEESAATAAAGLSGEGLPGLFTPSYLVNSTYMHQLREQHDARIKAQREALAAAAAAGPGGLHGKPQWHRGVAFEAAEKPLALDDDETLAPLPSKWNRDDKWGPLEVSGDGLEVKLSAVRGQGDRDHEACSVRADHAMPPQCGIYYYEITVLAGRRDDTTIGLGFASKTVALSRAPGWEPESWGYHGDDGNSFAAQNTGKQFGPPYTTGDTIGCGVNFRTGCAFYTKNGANLGTAFREVKGKLYPVVGLKKAGEHIRANFGQSEFVFDINRIMMEEADLIWDEIYSTSTSKLVEGLNETALIQALVLQFLQHDGYLSTAKAFAEELLDERQALSIDPNETVPGINIKDDDDANNRQRIRRAILEGDIDKALKHTNAYYPQVLKENEWVFFRLRCRKFIEMARKAGEMRRSAQSRHNGHGGATDADSQEEGMDLDSANGHENSDGNVNNAWNEPVAVEDLELAMVSYGQMLQAEYSSDQRREVTKALGDIYSLMAYTDPFRAPKAHLLDKRGRAVVAEELNAAILSSLGRSSRSALETIYSQTAVLLDELRQDGGPGAFVSVREVVDKIPCP